MKKSSYTLVVGIVLLLCSPGSLHAQDRASGRQVVAKGFEHIDSIRFGMLRPYDVAAPADRHNGC